MAYTYILYSSNIDRFYTGACQENLTQRIQNHNNGNYGGKAYTSLTNDWILFIKFECQDYPHAIRLERKIKSMKGKKYILNLQKYPELREKILNETKNT